ncbi:MAG: phosphatidylglycerophosphatase A [Planctomycetes bacterium]|nr:phosphatidylglycerophosphatase A [Planctomycetota bacterium]
MKRLLCTCFGVGLIPKVPGTLGSLAPLCIVLGCGHFGILHGWLFVILILLLVVSSIVTIQLAPWYADYFGQKDPPQIVSDEVAGQSIALLGMAWMTPSDDNPIAWIGFAVLAFVLFRIFDIWKPWIIDKSQNLPSGWGVLIDDILAGIAAGALVFLTAILT